MSAQVLRATWFIFLPLAMWLCGILLAVVFGKAERRRLRRVLLWGSPIILLQTALALFFVVILSKGAL
jgi:hypothetical protein